MDTSTSHSTQEWLAPPHALTLHEGEVHVWRGIVDIPSSRLQVFRDALNRDEQQRARRLRFPRHQRRFIAARGMLRFLLGHYLDLSPHEIELDVGLHGKPFVRNEGVRKLSFNVSHSQRIALFAFSHESEVGIDVEGPQPRLDYQAVAKRVLNSQEQQWLQSLPSQEQKSAFLTCWTRKEAFAKAHGTGLTFPFRDITVTLQPNQPASIVKIEDPWLNSRPWAMYPVYPRTRYAGALVVAGQPHFIKYWDYQEWKA